MLILLGFTITILVPRLPRASFRAIKLPARGPLKWGDLGRRYGSTYFERLLARTFWPEKTAISRVHKTNRVIFLRLKRGFKGQRLQKLSWRPGTLKAII